MGLAPPLLGRTCRIMLLCLRLRRRPPQNDLLSPSQVAASGGRSRARDGVLGRRRCCLGRSKQGRSVGEGAVGACRAAAADGGAQVGAGWGFLGEAFAVRLRSPQRLVHRFCLLHPVPQVLLGQMRAGRRPRASSACVLLSASSSCPRRAQRWPPRRSAAPAPRSRSRALGRLRPTPRPGPSGWTRRSRQSGNGVPRQRRQQGTRRRGCRPLSCGPRSSRGTARGCLRTTNPGWAASWRHAAAVAAAAAGREAAGGLQAAAGRRRVRLSAQPKR